MVNSKMLRVDMVNSKMLRVDMVNSKMLPVVTAILIKSTLLFTWIGAGIGYHTGSVILVSKFDLRLAGPLYTDSQTT